MFALGIVELLVLVVIVGGGLALVLYLVIRKATGDGARDAQRDRDSRP